MTQVISNETIDILKNFSGINQGMVFREGSKMYTVSPGKNIMGEATVKEVFPIKFGVYDLTSLISAISLFKEAPEITFGEKQLVISSQQGKSKITYRYTEPSLIVSLPESFTGVEFPSEDIKFSLSQDDLTWILKSADVLKVPNVVIESDGKKVFINSTDVKNDASNSNAYEMGPSDGNSYRMVFKRENLKFILANYDVTIAKMGRARFATSDGTLKYYVTTEKGSTFNGVEL